VALVLVGFLVVTTAVIWRRSVGIAHARELRVLDARRVQLESERAALQGAIRQAASRARIGAVAEERLGMRIPADTQVIILSRPQAPAAPAGRTARAAVP
jgi:cell division protein FtsL